MDAFSRQRVLSVPSPGSTQVKKDLEQAKEELAIVVEKLLQELQAPQQDTPSIEKLKEKQAKLKFIIVEKQKELDKGEESGEDPPITSPPEEERLKPEASANYDPPPPSTKANDNNKPPSTEEGGEPETKKQKQEEVVQPKQFPVVKQEDTTQIVSTFRGGRNPVVVALEKNVEEIARNGLTYLNMFVGSLGAAFGDRDVRHFYKWRDDPNRPGKNSSVDELSNPVRRGATSIKEFIIMNKHLGSKFLSIVIPNAMEKGSVAQDETYARQLVKMQTQVRIGEGFFGEGQILSKVPVSVEDEAYITSIIQRHVPDTGNFPNPQTDWVFGALDDATFLYLMEATSLGAMNMALSQIREIPNCRDFTLRQLMMSDGVRDKFAIFVVFHYQLMSGGNAYSGGANSSRGRLSGTTYMVSQGFQTRNALYAQVETGKYWFQRVYKHNNPRYAEMNQFITKVRDKLQEEKYGNFDAFDIAKKNRINQWLEADNAIEQLINFVAITYNTEFVTQQIMNENLKELAKQDFQKWKYKALMGGPDIPVAAYNEKVWKLRKRYAESIGNFPEDQETNYISITREEHGVEPVVMGDAYWLAKLSDSGVKRAYDAATKNARDNLKNLSEVEKAVPRSIYDMGIAKAKQMYARLLAQGQSDYEKEVLEANQLVNVPFDEDEVKIVRNLLFRLLTTGVSGPQLQRMKNSGYLVERETRGIRIRLSDAENERLQAMVYLRIMERQILGMPKEVLVHYD